MPSARLCAASSLVAALVIGTGAGCPRDVRPPSRDLGAGDGPTMDSAALIDVRLDSRVGVLLDDLPPTVRDRAAAVVLGRSNAWWREQARLQLRATRLRLTTFRRYYAAPPDGDPTKGQLPLPPTAQLTIDLSPSGPQRVTVDGHDLVAIDFAMHAQLLSDGASALTAEPALATRGGTWDETFTLPIDPELLFQRTGYACVHEGPDEPTALDGESALRFFDDRCAPGGTGLGQCQRTVPPAASSCKDALVASVGHVDVKIHFVRLAWDPAVAATARTPPPAQAAPDLDVLEEGLAANHVAWRYVPAGSCLVTSGCVGGSGWRRLLVFDSRVLNVGGQALHIGDVKRSPQFAHNVYQISPCGQRLDYRFYDTLTSGGGQLTTSAKRSSCLASTTRYANNETTPLAVPYGQCDFQGVAPGWGNDAFGGLACQWMDITALDPALLGPTTRLALRANPDQYLCEGRPTTDAQGNLLFAPTELVTEAGKPIDRPECTFLPSWDKNNVGNVDVALPAKGSVVTGACARGQLGFRRDCGYGEQQTATCPAGSTVKLTCNLARGAQPHVLRVCEFSQVLGGGVACSFSDALAGDTIVQGGSSMVTFPCPAARDVAEPGGRYTVYAGAAFDGDATFAPTCTAQF